MSAAWLVLYLGSLVHLLALNGYGMGTPASLLVLLPVVAAGLAPGLIRSRPALPPALLRVAGLAGFACALLFVKSIYLEGWDSNAWGLNLAIAGAGLGSLLPALAATGTPGAGAWTWVALWLGTGILDPALPLLGAGLGGMLEGSGFGIDEQERPATPALMQPGLALFLLGLALPKPWWDFGIEREWAWASAAFGLGAALVSLDRLRPWLARLPSALLLWTLGLLAILYAPSLGPAWGLVLGAAAGSAWARFPKPLPMEKAALAFLAGLLLSFALHANAWIPGLRHLIWLRN